jgi:hypothetical protein
MIKVHSAKRNYSFRWNSNCKAGSDQNNGWVQEGVDFYHDAWHKAAAACATPECKALEHAFLEWVQKGHKKPTPKLKDTNTKKRKEAPPSMLTLMWETLMMRGETGRR